MASSWHRFSPLLIGLFSICLCASHFKTRQRSIVDMAGGCGPTSLYALCQHFGIAVPPSQVFKLCGGDSVPVSSFAELEISAHLLGLQAEGLEMSVDELRRQQPLGILHVDENHFVAVIGYESAGPRVADPIAGGKTRLAVWPYARLAARWDGRILQISKTMRSKPLRRHL